MPCTTLGVSSSNLQEFRPFVHYSQNLLRKQARPGRFRPGHISVQVRSSQATSTQRGRPTSSSGRSRAQETLKRDRSSDGALADTGEHGKRVVIVGGGWAGKRSIIISVNHIISQHMHAADWLCAACELTLYALMHALQLFRDLDDKSCAAFGVRCVLPKRFNLKRPLVSQPKQHLVNRFLLEHGTKHFCMTTYKQISLLAVKFGFSLCWSTSVYGL